MSWEEIWRSLELVEFFNTDMVVDYALLLKNAGTVAKVGFFLEQHRAPLMVPDACLETLATHIPKSPRYMSKAHDEPARLAKRWNLIVPEEILTRAWEEMT